MRIKNKLRTLTLIIGIIVFAASLAAAQETTTTAQADKERVQAERLWEQVIKVKGGREKLHSITNMMKMMPGKKPNNIRLQLYVYPNKYWEWNEDKDFHDYLFITMVNLDLGVFLVAGHDGLSKYDKNVNEVYRTEYSEGNLMETNRFLLETRWAQPKPVRVTRQKFRNEMLDVIETHFPGKAEYYQDKREDFYVDPETLLVKAIVLYYKGRPNGYYIFDKYTTVDGIQMPTGFDDIIRIENINKPSYTPLNFRFNIEYDRELFERPPTKEAGADAWKPKSK